MVKREHNAVDRVGEMLKAAGYRALVDRETSVVTSGANGFTFIIIVFDDSIQFHCSVTLPDGVSVPHMAMNSVNEAYRFIRMFYDTERNAIAVQNDHFFTPRERGAADVFGKMVHLFDGALQSLKDLLFRLQTENIAATSADGTAHGAE